MKEHAQARDKTCVLGSVGQRECSGNALRQRENYFLEICRATLKGGRIENFIKLRET